jgi:hypothetical protein
MSSALEASVSLIVVSLMNGTAVARFYFAVSGAASGLVRVRQAACPMEWHSSAFAPVGQRERHCVHFLASPSPKRDINAVLAAHDKQLLALPDVIGVYIGTLEDNQTLCLKVMLSRENPETQRKIPPSIEGYPVRVEVSGTIRPMGQPSE